MNSLYCYDTTLSIEKIRQKPTKSTFRHISTIKGTAKTLFDLFGLLLSSAADF